MIYHVFILQLCLSSLCQYCWMTRYAYCSTGATQSSDIAIKFIFDVCADQLQLNAKKLTGFANGVHADEFLSVFENEVERAVALNDKKQNWGSKIEKISKDSVLLLLKNPTAEYSNYSQQIAKEGSEMSAEERNTMLSHIEILEEMRRSVQIFLLLRSATKRLKLILNKGPDFSLKDSVDMQGNADDLFCLMVDEFVRLLGPSTSSSELALHEGQCIIL